MNGAGCLAEFRVGRTHHLTSAVVSDGGNALMVTSSHDRHWLRRWSNYSHRRIAGFNTPGSAAVNSPAYDWAFAAAGIYAQGFQQRRTTFSVGAYDGDRSGWMRFFRFYCRVNGQLASCHNAFGDAIRYRP